MSEGMLIRIPQSNRRELAFNVLSNWGLESLDYRTRDPSSQNNDWIDEQVAIHLPNIQWVRQKRRDECLRRRF